MLPWFTEHYGNPHSVEHEMGTEAITPPKQRAGAKLDEKEMLRALGTELAKYKLPKRIHVADNLPRNAMGKVQKNELREKHKATFSAGS